MDEKLNYIIKYFEEVHGNSARKSFCLLYLADKFSSKLNQKSLVRTALTPAYVPTGMKITDNFPLEESEYVLLCLTHILFSQLSQAEIALVVYSLDSTFYTWYNRFCFLQKVYTYKFGEFINLLKSLTTFDSGDFINMNNETIMKGCPQENLPLMSRFLDDRENFMDLQVWK